jgi:hypothetical protein
MASSARCKPWVVLLVLGVRFNNPQSYAPLMYRLSCARQPMEEVRKCQAFRRQKQLELVFVANERQYWYANPALVCYGFQRV